MSTTSTVRTRATPYRPPAGAEKFQRFPLKAVPLRRPPTPRVPFVALVSLVLLVGVVGLLVFNTSMQQSSFAETALSSQAQNLTAREQTLRLELDALRDPQQVAAEATRLGMVPAPSTAILHLPSGRIEGTPTAASAEDRILLAELPPPRPAELDPKPIRKPALRDDVPAAETQTNAGRGDPEASTSSGRQNRRGNNR